MPNESRLDSKKPASPRSNPPLKSDTVDSQVCATDGLQALAATHEEDDGFNTSYEQYQPYLLSTPLSASELERTKVEVENSTPVETSSALNRISKVKVTVNM